MLKTSLLTALVLLMHLLRAQPGFLDTTFHQDGIVTTGFGSADDFGHAVVIQPDGKILVAGSTMSTTGLDHDFAIARYLPDGSLDPTFGNGGRVTTAVGSNEDVINAIALQPDGKIVVAGSYFNGIGGDFSIARYNPDGSVDDNFGTLGFMYVDYWKFDEARAIALQPDGRIVIAGRISDGLIDRFALVRLTALGALDTSFNTDGFMFFEFPGFNPQHARAIAIQPDGKIIIAGGVFSGLSGRFALARVTPSGLLDTGFGTAGLVTTSFMLSAEARGLVIQPDGKIIAAGYSYDTTIQTFDIALARYLTNGALDTSFSNDGKVMTDLNGYFDAAYSVALMPDGRIIAAGISDNGFHTDFSVARYTTNGSPDTTFDNDGTIQTDLPFHRNDAGNGMALQPDGRLVVAGYGDNGADNDFALVRYNTDGSLDNAFDLDGIMITDFTALEVAHAVTVQSNGRIVVAGEAQGDFAICRYRTNGLLDDGFSYGDGKNITSIGTYACARGVLIQPNHHIVLAGETRTGTASTIALVRYNPLGHLDLDFDDDGIQTDNIGSASVANAAALQADGKIVVAGWAREFGGRAFGLARYRPDGKRDTSFGQAGHVITYHGDADHVARAVAIQPDGKIIATGYASFDSNHRNELHYAFSTVRYHNDGSIDASFGYNGFASTSIGFNSIGNAIALQPDGKVIVAGTSDGRFALARYLPDGRRDPDFGAHGTAVTSVGQGAAATSVLVQADMRIIAAGRAGNAFAAVRYNADGSVDSTFGNAGIAITSVGSDATAHAAALGIDGKVVMAGTSNLTGDYDFTVVRFDNDVDSSAIPGYVAVRPETLSLSLYPNPVTDIFVVEYSLPRQGEVSMALFDPLGRRIQVIPDQERASGYHREHVRLMPGLASGLYVLTITTREYSGALQFFK